MFKINEAEFTKHFKSILKHHVLYAELNNQQEAARDLAKYMERDNSGSIVDEDKKTFDPTQADRRKGMQPTAFYESAIKVIGETLDDLDMYYFARHVLGRMQDEDDEALARICIAATPIGHYGKTLGSLKDVAGRLVATRDLYRDGDGGRYLLISMSDVGQVTIAPMHVAKDAHPLSLPTFNTEHYRDGEKTRDIDGFMMEADRYIFTIARDGNKLRIAKLVTHGRMKLNADADERMDLIGLRLGGFDAHKLPNAHRIYGYQLRNKERFEKIRANIKANGSERRFTVEYKKHPNEDSAKAAKDYDEREALALWLAQQFEVEPSIAKSISSYIFTGEVVPGNLNTPDPTQL